MATTFIEAIGTYLQAQGHGTLGTDLFIGLLPSSPDSCVTIYEEDAGNPILTAGATAIAVDVADLRVLVRSGRDDYATGRDKAATIRTLLSAITDQTLSGIKIIRCAPASSVVPYGSDESDRPTFLVKFRVHINP